MFNSDEKILVYPIDKEMIPVIKSMENYPCINIYRLISPESWGHGGECYKCAEKVIEISHDYEKACNDCTTVWIVDSWNDLDFVQFVKPAIQFACNKGKRIVCSKYLSVSEKESLSDVRIFYIEYSTQLFTVSNDDRLREIRTPILYAMSTTEFCNQFYIETAICAELYNRNYKVVLISSRKESVAFGQHSMPNFIFTNDYNENKKVIAMNRYIYNLEKEYNPDIIVIGVPGIAIPFDYRYSSDFGIIAYELSEAVKADFAVLSSLCMPYDVEYFKSVEKSFIGRLGIDIDVHSLSPYALDSNEASYEKKLSYLSVDDSYVCQTIENISYDKIINLNNQNGISFAVDRLINKLSGGLASIIT